MVPQGQNEPAGPVSYDLAKFTVRYMFSAPQP
jgi:hypothetical protein